MGRKAGHRPQRTGDDASKRHAEQAAKTLQPRSVALQPPSVTLQPPSAALPPPSVTLQPPSAALPPPSVTLQLPSAALPPPSVTLQPPSVTLQPPAYRAGHSWLWGGRPYRTLTIGCFFLRQGTPCQGPIRKPQTAGMSHRGSMSQPKAAGSAIGCYPPPLPPGAPRTLGDAPTEKKQELGGGADPPLLLRLRGRIRRGTSPGLRLTAIATCKVYHRRSS